MSAGKRYKFHDSQIRIMTGLSGDSPPADITGITKANPAVVTAVGHGLSDGDVVKLTEIVGMTELNDRLVVVIVLTSSTFELADVDSTGYTTYTSGGVFDKAVFSNFC